MRKVTAKVYKFNSIYERRRLTLNKVVVSRQLSICMAINKV